ncbi:MAG: tetratricopeptide repeat protein, partial [Candidatus Tectomicrobia bacterium]|nr:tetratricopeptide repeat protein [Candidatus Tectomicrobia bacterium]
MAWILDVWGWQRAWQTRVPALLAWGVLALCWSLVTSQVQPATALAVISPLWARPLLAGDVVTFYLAKLVVPLALAPDYGRSPAVVLAQGWFWLTGIVPWVLAGLLWWQRLRLAWLLAAGGVFVAGLLPVLGVVAFAFQEYSTVADRYTYLALLGPAVALAGLLQRWPRRALVVGCAVVLGLLGIRSAWQTRSWHDTVTLFTHALHIHPESSLAHNNLGMALAAANRLAEALPHYQEAVRVRPRNAEAHLNLGNVLARQGQSQEAMRHYMEALQLQPMLAEAHNSLGVALADQRRLDEARAHYAEAIRIRPQYARAYYNLANVLIQQGHVQEALHQYAEALRHQPTLVEAHGNLG